MKHECEKSVLYTTEKFGEEDKLIFYSKVFDEHGIIVFDGGESYVLISNCAWCGEKLPISKREEWFDKLEELGFSSPLFDENIPNEYKSDGWWKNNKLE